MAAASTRVEQTKQSTSSAAGARCWATPPPCHGATPPCVPAGWERGPGSSHLTVRPADSACARMTKYSGPAAAQRRHGMPCSAPESPPLATSVANSCVPAIRRQTCQGGSCVWAGEWGERPHRAWRRGGSRRGRPSAQPGAQCKGPAVICKHMHACQRSDDGTRAHLADCCRERLIAAHAAAEPTEAARRHCAHCGVQRREHAQRRRE